MKRGAVLCVLTGLTIGGVGPAQADLEHEASLKAYSLALDAYVQEALVANDSGESFLCGYDIKHRKRKTRTIEVKEFDSAASWHIAPLICAETTSRELISPTPNFALSGFEFSFRDKKAHKLNGVGAAIQSRRLERLVRRSSVPTVPMASDVIGEGELSALRLGRALIPLAWQLRLAEEALSPDNQTFGELTAGERAELQMLLAYLDDAPEPDEDAYTSYKDRLFPSVFNVLDRLGYAFFDGPEQLHFDRIARELFLQRHLNNLGEGEKAFQLTSESDKVSLLVDMIQKSDVRRALILFAKLDENRDYEFADFPNVYTQFRDITGMDAISGVVSFTPLNWGRIREASRPVDEDWGANFRDRASEARLAARAMRKEALVIKGGDKAGIREGSHVAADPHDIKIWDEVGPVRLSFGQTGLDAQAPQEALVDIVSTLSMLASGLDTKVWAVEPVKNLKAGLVRLEEVRDLPQDMQTQTRLADALGFLAGVSLGLKHVDANETSDAGLLANSVATQVDEARAAIYVLRAEIYEAHEELLNGQTKECEQTCYLLIEPPPFEAELALTGFYVNHTGGKAARLAEFSIEPTRVHGYDALKVRFSDKDGNENNRAYVQYTYVPKNMIAGERAIEVTGKGSTTQSRSENANHATYPLLQSFSIKLQDGVGDLGETAARDVLIEKLGIQNFGNQTRVTISATGKDGVDVTGEMAWNVNVVEVLAPTVTRPASKARPFVWPIEAN